MKMRYVKMLVIVAVVVTAQMAFLGVSAALASHGVLCSTATNPCTSKWAVGTTFDLSLRTESVAKWASTSGETLDSCTGNTTKLVLEANPDATGTATGRYEAREWTGCSFATTTTKLGKWKIDAVTDDSGDGWLYADEVFETTINTVFFGSCVYGAEVGTKVGTWKASTGVFAANAVFKRFSGGVACPETSKFTAEYVKTTPSTTLFVSTS
jgi:hypothetical protein